MAALTANRNTPELQHPASMLHGHQGHVTASSTQFYKGGLVCMDQADGLLKKGATSTTLVAIGRCEEDYLTGAGNTRPIKCRSGVFKWLNSTAGDAIAADDIGKDCFIVDNQTVALTDGTATRSKAGTVYAVDPDGVWVFTQFPRA